MVYQNEKGYIVYCTFSQITLTFHIIKDRFRFEKQTSEEIFLLFVVTLLYTFSHKHIKNSAKVFINGLSFYLNKYLKKCLIIVISLDNLVH